MDWFNIEDIILPSGEYTSCVRLGRQLFVGDCVEDSFSKFQTKYDGKRYIYPDGRTQVCKASQRVYRVPFPQDKEKRPQHRYFDAEGNPVDKDGNERGIRTDNLLRAKKRIQQIILCNSWDWFVTFTFDDDIVDASSIPLVVSKAQKWLNNQVSRRGIGYLLIPEYHKKDKRVHMHALISKLDGNGLRLVDSGTVGVEGYKKPIHIDTAYRYHLEDKILYKVYNVIDWKYGFTTAIDTYGSTQKLANYVMKYITKDMLTEDHKSIFGKYYWVSRNLQLFPLTELFMLDDYEYYNTVAKEYYARGSDVRYKYISRMGDNIEEE